MIVEGMIEDRVSGCMMEGNSRTFIAPHFKLNCKIVYYPDAA
jgi:hypothetical protein